jgi:DNA (cytosine-5)-methyltransferase 1
VEYANTVSTQCYPRPPQNKLQEALRTHNGRVMRAGETVTEHEYSNHEPYIREKYALMIANKGVIPEQFRTKKFVQRVLPTTWDESGPNITATSVPEHYVHYSQPRTPTVREWARVQTFPDWYQFAAPRSTGGGRRANDPNRGLGSEDVPKYTQIGNAVPVMLAQKIGKHLAKILRGQSTPIA